MGKEIERKFLVSGDGWKGAAQGVLYRQGYLCGARERTVRVRLAGGRAFLTVKGETTGITRAEYEYEIPVADGEAMLDSLVEKPIVEKRRYVVPYRGLVWEVDEFLGANAGLVLAEVELESEDQPFDKPAWAGEEVSGDHRYSNSSLARHPYSIWDSYA